MRHSHKQKGFTLIELMAVLGILAIIAIIATPVMQNVLQGANADSEAASASMIEKAAKIADTDTKGAAADRPGRSYSVQGLIDGGYLDYDGTLDGIAMPLENGGFHYTGENLILDSNVRYDTASYMIAEYNLTEEWELGQEYTIQMKGSVNEGQTAGVWANGSGSRVAVLRYNPETGLHEATFTPTSIKRQIPKILRVYNYQSTTAKRGTIDWIKMEKGSVGTPWSPAPSEL